MLDLETLTIAGVPLLLRPPANRNHNTPLILFWHGFGSPNGEVNIAESFALESVDAWKAYLGLTLFDQRSDGVEDLMRRQMGEYVLQLLLPVVEQVVQALPEVVAGLRSHCGLGNSSPIGLFGFSAGGLAALLALAESHLPTKAVVLAGVTKDLSAVVTTYERSISASYGMLEGEAPKLKPEYEWAKESETEYEWAKESEAEYEWAEESEAARIQIDLVAHSKRIAQQDPQPAILFVQSDQEKVFNLEDVEILHNALKAQYQQINHPERVSLRIFQRLRHAIDLASNSSSKQSADLVEMERAVADWFKTYL